MTELLEKLQTVKVGSLPGPPTGDVKTVSSDMTVAEVLSYLQQNNFLSAPVVDASVADDASWKERYIGVVDVVSLVVFAMNALNTPSSIPEEVEEGDENEFDISALPSEFADQPITAVKEHPEMWNDFLPIETDATLFDALVLLSNFRMKRVPVLDEKTFKVVNIVTQSTLMKALHLHSDLFGDIVKQTLDDVGLGDPKEVFSIRFDQPIKDAFDLIQTHKISGVPVLGVDGRLLGSISARDIFYIATSPTKFCLLNKKASRFLDTLSTTHGWDDSRRSVVSKSSETISEVMEKIVRNKAHRIFITDENGLPYRVVSLVDILAKFVSQPEAQCTLL
eukprot:m.34411 g.34411  ORF g.34411 m.34411 type:complete len:336 (-) comp6530_c0_seq1:1615-2622(-)